MQSAICAKSQKSQSKSNVNFSSDGRSAPLSNPEVDPCYKFIYAVNGKMVDPILVTVILDKVSVVMELDTGAACTLMSKSMYEQLWPVVSERPMLYSSGAKLRVYGGSRLKVSGEIVVTARIGNSPKSCSAKIIIVDGEGPCLLGRDLIQSLGFVVTSTKYLELSLLRKSFQNCFQKVSGATEGRNSQLRLIRQYLLNFARHAQFLIL